ncbi:glycosyltransferase family 4 protein [Achromobacter pulmonis]|uniref:glycosyltransferase family 4 protein n=1 Tax=Achromobacter pulmonis TaxID=1389932 RepID=UPI001F21F214|nr:glycosyltransferase family 4 protein [Achromobacter pulmonis]MCF7767871.1 glycosyltransferase family 4 protein [Achromobacter pulmonis]
MMTDDVQIDRRIIQEAKSLIARNHEVILLAAPGKNLAPAEIIEGVKVERVNFATGRQRLIEVIVTRIHGRSIEFANAGSTLSQRVVAKIIEMPFRVLNLVRRAIWRVIHPTKPAPHSPSLSRAKAKMQGGGMFIASRFFWLCAVLSNRLYTLTLRVIHRVARATSRDATLLERAKFYNPDIIHAHDLPQLRAGVDSARALKVPLIYDAHELYPEICTLTPEQQKRLGRIEKRLIKECDAVITVNPHLAGEFSRRYRIAAPDVILNAIDPFADLHDQPRDLFREELGIPKSKQILLFQGWMSPDRGLQDLVRALANVREEVHLVFMGYGELVADLTRIAQEVKVLDRVHFKNAVPQSELLYWTASADAGIIPYQPVDLNHWFCSPNKLFEFVQSRLPIIANDLPYLRDVIGTDGIGLVADMKSLDALSIAINEMFDPARGGATRFKPALTAAQYKYSWQAQETQLFEIYDRVVKKKAK